MTLHSRVSGMPVRTRWVWGGAAAVAVAALATWLVVAASDQNEAPPVASGSAGMEGMQMAGMDMGGDGSVRLTADQIRTFGVTFGTVEQRTLEDEVRTVGIVNFDETRMAAVTPRFSGYIERLYVDFTGRPVRRGEPMAEIYSPELVAAQEELLLAAKLEGSLSGSAVPGVPEGSSNLVAAAKQRLRLWDISETQIEGILKSGRARRTLTLHAPVAGIVVEKKIIAGQSVQAGQPLYTIADLSEVWVEAELREADAGLVQQGDGATVELAAFPGRPLAGRVEYVYPTLQSEARTLKARVAIPNPEGRLKPGMYATVRLHAPGRSALTVPTSAILNTGERSVVFVDIGGGRLMPHEVEIGRVSGGYAEVLAGVEPGQRVVTSAQYLLDSESNLAEVMKSMIGQMDMSDMAPTDMDGMDSSGADMKGMNMPERR